MQTVIQTDIPNLDLLSRGKVRDIYAADAQKLLIVTTDRISAFDVIMNEPIPYKGAVLNRITLFWMDLFKDIVQNHLVETDPLKFPDPLRAHAEELKGRAVLVHKAEPLPIECIVRGHITGSGWKDYQATGQVCGHDLPSGLVESQKLEEPLFTPSTKAELGEHDENIDLSKAGDLVGKVLLDKVQDISITLFKKGREYAEERGIIIADTKFEFGLLNGELLLIDEVLTPDSSRFWPKAEYQPGRPQKSFDKQYLRDWLSGLDWNKQAPPPTLPDDVISNTQAKYIEAFERITGEKFEV